MRVLRFFPSVGKAKPRCPRSSADAERAARSPLSSTGAGVVAREGPPGPRSGKEAGGGRAISSLLAHKGGGEGDSGAGDTHTRHEPLLLHDPKTTASFI